MDWEPFLPFVPTFFGVLAAFGLQWLAKRYDKRKDRQQFLQEVRKELESCSKLLTGEGHLLPTDMWESGKASGWLSLVKHEVKTKFASIYFRIECHNYEANRVRDASIAVETGKWHKIGSERTPEEWQWLSLSDRLRKEEHELKNDIDNIVAKMGARASILKIEHKI